MMSSKEDKNYYLNVIKKATLEHDISKISQERRLHKKNQSGAAHFIYDLSDFYESDTLSIKNILNIIDSNEDLLFMNPMTDFSFCKNKLLIKVLNTLDFEIVKNTPDLNFVFIPHDQACLKELISEYLISPRQSMITWQFLNYDVDKKKSLSIIEIAENVKKYKLKKSILPLWNTHTPAHYELESTEKIHWRGDTVNKNLELSIIIPTYNNCLFLCNVVQHLIQQSISCEKYEIIIVDDGSHDDTKETLYSLLKNNLRQINIKYVYWPKENAVRGKQNFFRAGLARNLAVHYSESSYLFFLDSDMLVPSNFVETIIENFKNNDVLQFTRFHIKQAVSKNNPPYKKINIFVDTYVEEKTYWNQLFTSNEWQSLTHFWKYTCTYALGIKKQDFYDCGRFKRHFISYGFEDTDIGYRLYKKNKKFILIQNPLLHLTNYSNMQYQNSKFLRDQLLRKTCKLFYLDHLDEEIFTVFKFYYQFEKSLYKIVKDFF